MEVLDPTVTHDDAPLCVNDSLEKVTLRQIPSDTKSSVKARHVLGFLGFLGFALVYAMRVNLSVAIVSMVNQTAFPDNDNETNTDVCPKVIPVNETFIPVDIFFFCDKWNSHLGNRTSARPFGGKWRSVKRFVSFLSENRYSMTCTEVTRVSLKADNILN
uniref:Picot_12 protein n=1 Tax=Fopius arisanus TaxID=64838 RepID=A0A0C9QYJ7_9HYME